MLGNVLENSSSGFKADGGSPKRDPGVHLDYFSGTRTQQSFFTSKVFQSDF